VAGQIINTQIVTDLYHLLATGGQIPFPNCYNKLNQTYGFARCAQRMTRIWQDNNERLPIQIYIHIMLCM